MRLLSQSGNGLPATDTAPPDPRAGRNSSRAIHIGCSGWQYRDWCGVLYPEGLAQRRWLERYAVFAYFNSDWEGFAIRNATGLGAG